MTPAGDGLLISTGFWGAFALYVIVDRALIGWLPPRARYAFTALGSAGFLWYFTGVGARYLLALHLALGLIFLAARRFLRDRPPVAHLLFPLGFVGAIWSLGKIGASLALSRLSWLFFIGASFLLVKVWTFYKDAYDGRIEHPRVWTFLAYCTFFPCFLSGPMHYYGEFEAAFERRFELDGRTLVDAVFRLLHGLVKVLIVAVALRPYSLEVLRDAGLSQVSPLELVGRAVVYSLVIYLDFSGYSDIAIASGALLGIRVPENFRLPYLAADLREFWQRWHITFTRVLTQYLFVPLVRVVQARFRGLSAVATSTLAYLTTFLFCGFWHGSTANYLVWGLYHGLGLVALDLLRRSRTPRRPRAPGPARFAAQLAGRLATFGFVSLGWLFFRLPLGFWSR